MFLLQLLEVYIANCDPYRKSNNLLNKYITMSGVYIYVCVCTQYNSNDHIYPLLPSNEFLLTYNKQTFIVDNAFDYRWQYHTRMAMHSHKHKCRKHIDGALYSDIFMDNAESIDIEAGNCVDIVVRLADGMTTTVTTFVDIDEKNHHL